MVAMTSKITPIGEGCKIFELTKVNLLSLFELVLDKDARVVAFVK